MKRILKLSVAGILTCLILLTSVVTAFADNAATVNGQTAPVGSTVEYTLYLESKKQDVVGIQMFFKFSNDILTLKNVNLDSFPGATLNANNANDGMIYFNFSNLDGVNFKSKGEVAKLTFEVAKEGNADIAYFIQYLYDIDIVNIYDYTLTYDLVVDGNAVVKAEKPALADMNKVAQSVDSNFDWGDFANNQEGTGSGIKPQVATKTPTPNIGDNVNVGGGEAKGNDMTIVYVIAGVAVAGLIAVIVISVIKNKNSKESQN